MAAQPTEPIKLPNEPCIHGMSDKNWCAFCRQASGDKHAKTVIKAFSPKTPKSKKGSQSKVTIIN